MQWCAAVGGVVARCVPRQPAIGTKRCRRRVTARASKQTFTQIPLVTYFRGAHIAPGGMRGMGMAASGGLVGSRATVAFSSRRMNGFGNGAHDRATPADVHRPSQGS